MSKRWSPEDDDIYRCLCTLYGFDPLAEADVVAGAERMLAEVAT